MESNKNSVEESFLNNQSMLNFLEFENVTQSKKDYQNAKMILDNFLSEQETWSETVKDHYQKILEALNQ